MMVRNNKLWNILVLNKAVENNIIEVNTLATLTTLLILWNKSDSGFVVGDNGF